MKLYYTDQYQYGFEAKIVHMHEKDGAWHVALDQTAFYPGGGGQPHDFGTLDGQDVMQLYEADGNIYHVVQNKPASSIVQGKIDFARRFRFMQNHCGEHILSGLAKSVFEAENVGFHMSEAGFTMDLDKPLTNEQVKELEQRANAVVLQALPVEQTFKKGANLTDDDFRSKKQFTSDEDVRFVTIDGVDRCACAALHVKNTLAVGVIKIVSVQKYKKGVRLTAYCGVDAYDDYSVKNDICKAIGVILSADTKTIVPALEKLNEQKTALQKRAGALQNQIFELTAQNIKDGAELVYFVENEIDVPDMRRFVAQCAERAKIAVVLGGQDGAYKYAAASKHADEFADFVANFNQALNGSGGAKGDMATGICKATLDEITAFLKQF